MVARAFATILLFACFTGACATLRAQETGGDSTAAGSANGAQSDVDYGQRIEDGRQDFLDRSVRNRLFWTNILTLLIGGGLLLMLLHAEKESYLWQIFSARCAAFYHNQLVDAHDQLEQINDHCAELEKESERRKAALIQVALPAGAIGQTGSSVPSAPANLPSSESLLRAEIKRLEQQNAQQKTTFEKQKQAMESLRQTNERLEELLEEERQKNRRLKGE